MSINSNEDVTVVEIDVKDETVLLDVHRHRGSEWFLDDFPCAGPAYVELSSEDKRRLSTWLRGSLMPFLTIGLRNKCLI